MARLIPGTASTDTTSARSVSMTHKLGDGPPLPDEGDEVLSWVRHCSRRTGFLEEVFEHPGGTDAQRDGLVSPVVQIRFHQEAELIAPAFEGDAPQPLGGGLLPVKPDQALGQIKRGAVPARVILFGPQRIRLRQRGIRAGLR